MANFLLFDHIPLLEKASINKMIDFIIKNEVNLNEKTHKDILSFVPDALKAYATRELEALPTFETIEEKVVTFEDLKPQEPIVHKVVKKLVERKQETLGDIGTSISKRCNDEYRGVYPCVAVARVQGKTHSTHVYTKDFEGPIWLTNDGALGERQKFGLDASHMIVNKNTKMGEIIIKHVSGHHEYKFLSKYPKGNVKVDLDIFNHAVFDSNGKDVHDVRIYVEGDKKQHAYYSLSQLLNDVRELKKKAEEQRKVVEEQKRKEAEQQRIAEEEARKAEEARKKAAEEAEKAAAAAKAADEARKRMEAEREAAEAARLKAELERKEAEQRRIEEEVRKKEEEMRRAEEEAARQQEEARRQEEARIQAEQEAKQMQQEIEELERRRKEAAEMIRVQRGVIRNDFNLRSQHILDPSQEDAKRSHIFDGVPIVIEGGPGTGKTTTMIQRLKFLLSYDALNEYDSPLTNDQIRTLTDSAKMDKNWLFFSPTQQLLTFLRQNMLKEGLHANQDNTTILSSYDKLIMRDYKLKGPFKYREASTFDSIFVNPEDALLEFEIFSVQYIVNILKTSAALNTAAFSWHNLAVRIKNILAGTENMKMDTPSLITIISQLHNLESEASLLNNQLKIETYQTAHPVLRRIYEDVDLLEEISELFDEWEDDGDQDETPDVAADEMQDEQEEEISIRADVETKLSVYINAIVRVLALRTIEESAKMSEKQTVIYEMTKDKFEGVDFTELAGLVWFNRKYAVLLKGVKINLLEQYPKIYKDFKKQKLAEEGQNVYREDVIKKFKGTALHPDELHLLVGFINRQIQYLKRIMGVRLEENGTQKFVEGYNTHAKYVIGVDEATDYSWLDYYFITSFAHHVFSTITLCGDVMQGLNQNGITSWKTDLQSIMPKLKVYPLKISYRQSNTLVAVSRKMYKDDQGKEAPFKSTKEKMPDEPAALCCVSDDEEKKAHWIAKRVIDVYKAYNEHMPSVAIFVGQKEEIPSLIQLLKEEDRLNSIDIVDCSDNRISQSDKCVRVFDIKEVKGMEFEVAFFHNIDKALDGNRFELMRRYLYVGISRASNYLAATFTQEEGNEEILKYFNRNKRSWKI